jgi:FlaA1/EpsC-like NDP-sugar epimerase
MARQIASYSPAKLILVDQAETPMHDLMLEIREMWKELDIQFIVSSITNKYRMEKIFREYRPDYVFHAAAYKHVPMMEDNPSISIQNNVVGTRVLADLAVQYHVKKFVMISTDKAVNPTNVMGCSKRLCEIYVQSLNAYLAKSSDDASKKTQFVTTRFGNVLGSNGSVIPLFKKQIEAGGPVTVTHPDIIRYFMLIPEACALVLEAGTMGNGGEVFVFDMGQPVKIADLAKRLIQNSGRRDVKIEYTGLRDGEKLYEEVLFKGEEEVPTVHPKIHVAKVRQYEYEDVCKQFDELEELSKTSDDICVVRKMKMIVPEFRSNNSKYEEIDKELDEMRTK